MSNFDAHKNQLTEDGFTVLPEIYTFAEVNQLISLIEHADSSNDTFRKTTDLFAIRQFLKEIPEAANVIFNEKLKALIEQLFGRGFFAVKSIYFDKPADSNWYVAYHQDLTISVDKKMELAGFGPWTVKQNQFAVQPPLEILENNFTIRIHLDDTNSENGALKVIPGSHAKGVYRPETIDWTLETEANCDVPQGGVMIMKPLLLHSSGRTTNCNKRRVIHVEFSYTELPKGLLWSEQLEIN